jgi:hypothetical protein
MQIRVILSKGAITLGLKGYLPTQSTTLTREVSNYLTQPMRFYTYGDSLGLFDTLGRFETKEGEYIEVSFPNALTIKSENLPTEIVNRLNKFCKAIDARRKYELVEMEHVNRS